MWFSRFSFLYCVPALDNMIPWHPILSLVARPTGHSKRFSVVVVSAGVWILGVRKSQGHVPLATPLDVRPSVRGSGQWL